MTAGARRRPSDVHRVSPSASRRLPTALVATSLAVLTHSLIACGDTGEEVQRLRAPEASILLITVDTLRADHLGSYGYARDTSPNIDALARGGVLIDAAFSQRGLTFPSIASIMTSQHVYSHGVTEMPRTALAEEHETLAETLHGHGLRTVGFSAHLALTPQAGFAQGFDHYFLFHGDREDRMVKRVVAWLRKHRGERFFAWVHFFGPHSPYQPPAPWSERYTRPDYEGSYDGSQEQLYEIAEKQELSEEDRRHIIGLYDGKLRRTDHYVGQVLEELDALDLRRDTLVVLTADHGEELFDHRHYFSHEGSIYHGVLRIPLILSLPGRLPEGTAIRDHIVQSIDIMPTVLDLVGLEPPAGAQGRSLLPLLAGARMETDGRAYGSIDELDKSILTVRTPRWRYVYNPDRLHWPELRIEREELYDVQRDPGERRNLVMEHPEVAAELLSELVRWKAWSRAQKGATLTLDDPELEAHLRALGYVVGPAAGPAAIPDLVSKLRHSHQHDAREAAAKAFVEIGGEAVPTLIELLSDDYDHVQWWAAEALGEIGRRAAPAVPALMDTLESNGNLTVRWRAAQALGSIGDPAARAALRRASLDDESEAVRQIAGQSLKWLR